MIRNSQVTPYPCSSDASTHLPARRTGNTRPDSGETSTGSTFEVELFLFNLKSNQAERGMTCTSTTLDENTL